jgi:hypothetical protein
MIDVRFRARGGCGISNIEYRISNDEVGGRWAVIGGR